MSLYQYRLIRFGLVYLVLTGVLGVLFLISPATIGYFRVTHVHLGFVGFFLSMVMGVAYWMMPRPKGLRQEGLEAVTFYLLNAGIIGRIVFEPWWRASGGDWLQSIVIFTGLLQLGAMVTFAYAMFNRVKTADMIRRLREA